MSREKDSAIVYELVTSKYKIAERNRLAKFRFLNEMRNGGGSTKRRDSEPTMAQTETANVARVDISVPGTPVSSRYVLSLKKRKNYIESDSENEDEGGATDKPLKFQSELEEGLKKFTADMEKLQDNVSHDPLKKYFEDSDKKKTFRRDFSEVVSEFSIKKNEPETIAKVEKYFQESERMNSFKRDFTEVFQTFDPKNPSGREQFTDLMKIGTPISSRLIAVEKLSSAIESESVNDTEISIEIVENDKNSQVQLNSNGVNNKSVDVTENVNDGKKSEVNESALKIVENDDATNIKIETLQEAFAVNAEKEHQTADAEEKPDLDPLVMIVEIDAEEKPQQESPANDAEETSDWDPPKRLKRTDSTSSNISVPGTPISSRELSSLRTRNFIDTDDSGSEDEEESQTSKSAEIKALAKEFVHEIEHLVQKSFDDDRQEIVLEELKKITSDNVDGSVDVEEKLTPTTGESNEKLIIHEEQQGDSNPDGSSNKVEDYFEMSKRENTYKRTFSEVENFNKVSLEVKQKVENYFRESEQKKSLTRPFSQAINYVEPKADLEKLLKPGTPISSEVILCLKKQAQSDAIEELEETDPETLKGQEAFRKAQEALQSVGKENLSADDYFTQSLERNTYRRDFSEVLGQLNEAKPSKNPEIEKYFEQSDAQKSFQRPFSEVFQSVPPRIEDILKVEEKVEKKNGKPLHYQRSSRTSSISSNCSDQSESGQPKKTKHGKKYGIDKYFAASLYRTAYHRSNSRRESRDGEHDPENDLKIIEDEDVFGETDLLRQRDFQHDDETRVTQDSNDVNENQTVHFWRDFLKPYNLDLQTELSITRDDLLNNRTLE